MSYNNLDKESIIFKLTIFVIYLIVIQAVILIVTLILGGVLEQGKKNAYQFFNEKVNNRRKYIEREMKNRWTNIDPYVEKFARNFSRAKGEDDFFDKSAKDLVSMLRTIHATGAFIILEDKKQENIHPALYMRDYDPSLYSGYDNKDLYLIRGSSDLARKLKIPLERGWRYNLELTEENRSFYDQPYSKASLSSNPSLLGYWSTPFRLYHKATPIITYTIPFFDADNQLQGVIGVEILISYLKDFLPKTELEPKNSLGYLLAYKGKDDEIRPIITVGALQERMLQKNKSFSFRSVDQERDIYLLENHNSKEDIYAVVKRMGFYNYSTPFEDQNWYLIGLMTENSLLSYVIKIQRLLWISLLVSILLGALGGYFISYRFTKPIISLAKKVRGSDKSKAVKLEPVGLSEVDQLVEAMEDANNALEEKIEEITRLSETDQLTGIYNRVKFIKGLEKEINRVERYQSNLSLIMFDIDHFKEVNDNYGHDIGDQVLIKLTKLVSRLIRETDVFARWGGEEFMILTPHTNLNQAIELAERIRKTIQEAKMNKVDYITCSFGVTAFKPKSDADEDDFTKRVDNALYQAKENGRNQVVSI